MISELTIVIPAYNESENIPVVLPVIIDFAKSNNFKLILVNDGSSDNTIGVLKSFPNDEILTVMHHKLNKGYGAALKTGLEAVTTTYAITVDADGQHDFDDIKKLYEIAKERDADMIVGSRRNQKSSSRFRSIGKWLIRSLTHVLVSKTIWDINSGMKIYRTDLVRKYLYLCPDTMAFSDIITLVFLSQRHLVLEKEINIKKRLGGESTIGVKTAFQTVLEIFNIVMLFNPLKIFLTASVFFFIFGFAWGIPIVLAGRGISIGASLLIIMSILFFFLGLIAEQLSAIRKQK